MALLSGLSKTRRSFFGKIKDLITLRRPIDDALLERLEEALLSADVGVDITVTLLDRLREQVREKRLTDADGVTQTLKDEMKALLPVKPLYDWFARGTTPLTLLVVGVNGAGKTTSTGKLAFRFKEKGMSVLFAACDTFRAAAVEQLQVWAKRAGSDIVMQQAGADPAAVAFDAYAAAKARGIQVLLCDTAGRLHTKANLMAELRKIKTVLQKSDPSMRLRTLLVLDGTNGQNALNQARLFNETAEIDGLILTKLDGTAKGGAVFSISRALNIPIEFIGTGEALEDLELFDSTAFVDAFFEGSV